MTFDAIMTRVLEALLFVTLIAWAFVSFQKGDYDYALLWTLIFFAAQFQILRETIRNK